MRRMTTTRQRLLLLTACSVASGMVFSTRVWAQTAVSADAGATSDTYAIHIAKVKKLYKELLLKEKNVAAAVSEISPKQIEAEGVQAGSIQSLLKQTPSVNEYQQNAGQGVPVLTIRGARYSQLAETLDGTIPLQDILSGAQGGFLNNNIGSPVTLGQIGSSTVYPGVAPPNKQGFATVGGTIAYETKKPTADPYMKLFAGYGSFNSSHAGFEINTGDIGTPGPNAPRVLLRYGQAYTSGFPDNNNIRSGEMLFSALKPYNDGLSHLSAVVIYNRADGYLVTAPLPVPLINANSYSYNFPKSLTYTRQDNTYLTAYVGDETYINPHLIVSGKLFYQNSTSDFTSFQNPSTIAFNPNFPYQVTFQVPYFAYGDLGPGSVYQVPGYFSYNPTATFGNYLAGESAEYNTGGTKEIGFTPTAHFFYPHNNITIGGLFVKETTTSGASFVYGSDPMPQTIGYNSIAFGGGSQRTVSQVYLQDRIDLLNNKLHIEPGVNITGVYSSTYVPFSGPHSSATDPNGQYKLQNFGKQADPYLGISYDLPDDFIAYASYGKGARYAPLSDYSLGIAGSSTQAPKPEVVHLYEAGIRYDTPRLYLNADIFYQKITSAFSFYTNYQTGFSSYANTGGYQYRGYEASGKFRVTPDLQLFGNFSYNEANYLDSYYALVTPFQGQFGYVFRGEPLSSVPDFLGNFGVQYDHGPYSARLSGQYTGQQFITFDFSPQLPANPEIAPPNPNSTLALATTTYYPTAQGNLAQSIAGLPNIQHFKLPAYLLMNLLLSYDMPIHGYRIHNLKFTLNIKNLLGLHYYQHYFLAPAEIPQNGGFALTPTYASAYVGPPRAFYFDVSAKF